MYTFVNHWLPLTASDIAHGLRGNSQFADKHYQRLCQVRRRLSDLRAAGLIEPHGERDGESCWRRKL